MTPTIRLLMRVLTVRSVATFLRAPWCNSIVMIFLDGWEKQTDKWDISLTSLPAIRETRCFYSISGASWHTSRTFHTDYPRFDMYLDYLVVSLFPAWFSKMFMALCLASTLPRNLIDFRFCTKEIDYKQTHHWQV